MTTALIKAIIKRAYGTKVKLPSDAIWFDISDAYIPEGVRGIKNLLECRPPFARCVVVANVPGANDFLIMVSGDDPELGIYIGVTTGILTDTPYMYPKIVYKVEGGAVSWCCVDANDHLEDSEGENILKSVGFWYGALRADNRGYKPFVEQTFTNKRKIREGKKPALSWTVVTIGDISIRRQSGQGGGTHASPRAHERRGHLRTLSSGKTVWVRQCKVGKAENGTVNHVYRVKGKSE